MEYDILRNQLQERGYVVVRRLLSKEEAAHYVHLLEARSGIQAGAYQKAAAGRGFSRKGIGGAWNLPDGVSKTADFWELITHERLLAVVRALLGPDVRYLQHSDLHVGFSAVAWHRDNVNRKFNVGSDWDETAEPYRLVRVGIYLQEHAVSNFELGLIDGSHRPAASVSWGRRLTEARLQALGALSYAFAPLRRWAANAAWIATDPGDCIIFDPRCIHSGSYITGPKYSMFLAYGIENRHFAQHYNYYRRVRTELNYQDLAPELVAHLQAADLYPHNPAVFDPIKDAWLPTPILRRTVARQVKSLQ